MCFSIQQYKNITEHIKAFYSGFDKQKSFPDIVNIDERDIETLFSDDELNTYVRNIYDGVARVDNIPFNVYKKVGEVLEQGVFKGFGGSSLDFKIESPALKMVENLRTSTWVFSGVKNATHIFEAQQRIFDKDGFKRPFNKFRDDVNQMFETRYDSWLKAEFQTAIAQSRGAVQWQDITENGLDVLQYLTIGDGRVRPEHASLNGITRPKNDPFWSKYFPPNGWNCRCDVIELDEGDEPLTDLSTREIEPITPLFEGNAGIEQIAFPTNHPYFNIGKSSKELRELAKKNFNLPIPPPSPKLKKTISDEPIEKVSTIKQAKTRIEKAGVLLMRTNGISNDWSNVLTESVEMLPKRARPEIISNFTEFQKITGRKFNKQQNANFGIKLNSTDYKIKKSELTPEMNSFYSEIRESKFDDTVTLVDRTTIVGINTRKFKTPDDILKRKREIQTFFIQKGEKYYIDSALTKPKFTIVHEMGHVFDDKVGATRFNQKDSLHWELDRWYKQTKIGHLKPNSEGVFREAFADAFADYYLTGGKNLPEKLIVELEKLLN